MNLSTLLFHIHSTFAILFSLMVINLSNAVYSVFFLILVFCSVAEFRLLLGVEFLFLMLIVFLVQYQYYFSLLL